MGLQSLRELNYVAVSSRFVFVDKTGYLDWKEIQEKVKEKELQ